MAFDLRRPLAERDVRFYLGSPVGLLALLFVDGLAFLVGVRFYVETLPAVPTFLWPLYGDSPTALALGALALATLLPNLGRDPGGAPANRPLAYLYTFAFVWLFKYGLWTAVALNRRPELYVGFDAAGLYDYWFILLTHLLFVVHALLLAYPGRTTRGALAAALGALLANDLFDYAFGYHPPLRYEPGIVLPAATVALSILSVLAARWYLDPLGGAIAPDGSPKSPEESAARD